MPESRYVLYIFDYYALRCIQLCVEIDVDSARDVKMQQLRELMGKVNDSRYRSTT